METKYGTIIVKVDTKGYGFIKPDGTGRSSKDNLFFHTKDLLTPKFEELKTGERVEYLEKVTDKGKAAYDIAVI